MSFPNPFVLMYQGTALTTRLLTWLVGQRVGVDVFGNRYYRRRARKGEREKRWVIYRGIPEPSKVPPEWHGWLHYTLKDLPTKHPATLHVWQKQAQPNLSGSSAAYLPAGHLAKGGRHAPTVVDIGVWDPQALPRPTQSK